MNIRKKHYIILGIIAIIGSLIILFFTYEPFNLFIRCDIIEIPSAMNRKAFILYHNNEYEKARQLSWKVVYKTKEICDKCTNEELKDSCQRKAESEMVYALLNLIVCSYEIKQYNQSICAANFYLQQLNDDGVAGTIVIKYLGMSYEALKDYEKAYSYYISYIPDGIINEKHPSKEEPVKSGITIDIEDDILEYNRIIFQLALFYTYGQGCSIDLEKAANLWQYLDNRQITPATYNLALCYLHGDGVVKSYPTAFALCKKAADRGDVSAMKLLAKMYQKGIGCEKSESAARHWKEMAEQAEEQD